ncbi:hypothetical protein CLOLEP_01591 [[Clostridium] leptum DSM 753]|uniref:Uncharacterized protein n=1 Tax=[Clostridium] leptum DSM 753 TaxID=428125 RepID=A7VSQ0_9FIRM|nr:hypothetical protein CLOLEP_01591 [[Clostridium] leptum DSM 753]
MREAKEKQNGRGGIFPPASVLFFAGPRGMARGNRFFPIRYRQAVLI